MTLNKHDRDELLRWLAGELVAAAERNMKGRETLTDGIARTGRVADAVAERLADVPLGGAWNELEKRLDGLGLAIVKKGEIKDAA